MRHLEQLFRHRVLKMLQREGRIDEALIRKLLGWRHSGFSVSNAVRIDRQDAAGRRAVAEYTLRSPFSQQKMRYHAKSRSMVYRAKMRPVLKRNFEVFPVLDWLAALTAHIPNPGDHVVRYHGWYRNVSAAGRPAVARTHCIPSTSATPFHAGSRELWPKSTRGPTSKAVMESCNCLLTRWLQRLSKTLTGQK